VIAVLTAVTWAVMGAATGGLVRVASLELARGKGLEVGRQRWHVYGPLVLMAVLYGAVAGG
jgi:hypothetical protein